VSSDAGNSLEAVAAMSNSSASPTATAGSAPVGEEAGMLSHCALSRLLCSLNY